MRYVNNQDINDLIRTWKMHGRLHGKRASPPIDAASLYLAPTRAPCFIVVLCFFFSVCAFVPHLSTTYSLELQQCRTYLDFAGSHVVQSHDHMLHYQHSRKNYFNGRRFQVCVLFKYVVQVCCQSPRYRRYRDAADKLIYNGDID